MIKNIPPLKFKNGSWIFFQFGRGEKIGWYAMRYIIGKEPNQIVKSDSAGEDDAELAIHYDLGEPNISRPHWQGHCFIDPQYDSKEFREGLIDHLLDQKIVERPALIGFTGWDRSGKVQGSVARYGDDGQDIYIGGD
jgi:hypothetical protein